MCKSYMQLKLNNLMKMIVGIKIKFRCVDILKFNIKISNNSKHKTITRGDILH